MITEKIISTITYANSDIMTVTSVTQIQTNIVHANVNKISKQNNSILIYSN